MLIYRLIRCSEEFGFLGEQKILKSPRKTHLFADDRSKGNLQAYIPMTTNCELWSNRVGNSDGFGIYCWIKSNADLQKQN
jgi:hypothetical protein